MAAGVNYWSTYDSYKVSEYVWGCEHEASSEEEGSGVTWATQAMEVKGQIISVPDPVSCPNRKQRVEQMSELLERRRSLQTLLSTRLAELKRICLQEAELTGEVPSDYPLEVGEKPPYIRRRLGTSRQGTRTFKAEEEDAQRSKPKKTLFSGALRKHTDSEQNTYTHHGKRTVHRGCHTDDTVKSESSSTSDSTGHDNDDSVSQCRPLLVSVGSPVEVYYQIKTRRNSLASSNNSPSRSLPRSVSNLEGRSVPATPLLSRNRPITAHIRNEHPEILQHHKLLPLPSSHPPPHPLQPAPPAPHSHDGSSSSGPSETGVERGVRGNGDTRGDGGVRENGDRAGENGVRGNGNKLGEGRVRRHGNRVGEGRVNVNAARRSNSSDGLLDRTTSSEEEGGPGQGQGGLWLNNAPPCRKANTSGSYKSSEIPMEGRMIMMNGHAEAGGRGGEGKGGGGGRGGYSNVLLDYVWGKQQKMQLQRQQSQGNPRQPITLQHPLLYNGYPSHQPPGQNPSHLPTPPPAYRGHLGDQRRVKVTRTKSCGPFLPVQQNHDEPYLDTHNPPLSTHPHPPPTIQPDPHPHFLPPRPPQPPPAQDGHLEDATRSLHKALALEGLRDWYLRNTLGPTHQNQVNGKVKGQDGGGGGALQRRRTTHGVIQQSAYQTEMHHQYALPHHKQTPLPHSATFHGHPLHGRSLYQDSFPSQKQELPVKDPTTDQPSPGTLV